VIAVEYPGYGLYAGIASEEAILQDAVRVFDFVTTAFAMPPTAVSVVGRSLGTGPATHLASVRQLTSVILISPFESINRVSETLVFGRHRLIRDLQRDYKSSGCRSVHQY